MKQRLTLKWGSISLIIYDWDSDNDVEILIENKFDEILKNYKL